MVIHYYRVQSIQDCLFLVYNELPGGCGCEEEEALWNSLTEEASLTDYYFHVLKPAENTIVTEKKVYLFDEQNQ